MEDDVVTFRLRASAGVALWLLVFSTSVVAQDKDTASPETEAATKPADTQEKNDTPELFQKGSRLEYARVRVELTTMTGFHSGRRSRSGDYAIRSNVDYEIPIVEHLTIAPRIIPLMYYNENGDGDNNIWAGGIGVVFRGYSNGKEQRGWFGEIGLHGIAQSDKFEGNTGIFNFMEEAGFGYLFKKGWHVAVKTNHISNAGFAANNSGVNNVGIGFGYSFKR